MDSSYGPRSCDKSKVLPLSQVNQISIRRSLLTTHHKKSVCNKCKRTFKTHWGLQQHQRSCKENQVTQSNLTILSSKSISLTTDTSDNIWNENIKKWKHIGAFLISNWSSREGIHWIRLVNSWTYKSDLETIAFKALMIMPGLLLQKTFLNSKSKENSETLKRRLLLWKNGQLDQFIFERNTIKARQATK